MATIIIPKKVDCIIQDGVRYCENQPINLKEFGLSVIVITIWFVFVLIALVKAMDEGGWWWFLPLFVFLLPFILMLFI